MPTQEELNAANVELNIANDNYAQLVNKYNQYQNVFNAYVNATPEQQAKAKWAMQEALNAFQNLKLDMYTAENRIQQAQNRVNSYNETIANQSAPQPVVKRRTVTPPNPEQTTFVNPNHYFGWEWWTNNNWTLVSPEGWTIIYPDWSIQFWWDIATAETPTVEQGTWTYTVPYVSSPVGPTNYYDTYSQMKATWASGPEYVQYFKQFWNPVYGSTSEVRKDLINRKWLTSQQADDFIRDWGNATLRKKDQYTLTSPYRVQSNPWSYGYRTAVWGNWTWTLL